jgi:serine acetyltransferase
MIAEQAELSSCRCHIGEGAVIGSLSLVNTDIPSYSDCRGIPAKVIGEKINCGTNSIPGVTMRIGIMRHR